MLNFSLAFLTLPKGQRVLNMWFLYVKATNLYSWAVFLGGVEYIILLKLGTSVRLFFVVF